MINATVSIFYFPYTLRVMAFNMLQLDPKLGEICGFLPLGLVTRHFQEIDIAALPMGLKPRHVEKFQECRLTDVEESELTEKKKKHVQGLAIRCQ